MEDIPYKGSHAHSYDAKNATYFSSRRDDVAKLVPRGVGRLLDIGCGEGAFGAGLKEMHSTLEVWGIEPVKAAAVHAERRLDRVICAPIEDAMVQIADGSFNCITFNDVLEHLVDPWSVLKNVRAKLAPDGVLLASIPNLRYLPVLKALIWKGEFEYVSQGVMDATHLRFFTKSSILALMTQCGYTIDRIDGLQWAYFPFSLNVLNRLLGRRFDDLHFQQFVVQAVPTGSAIPESAGP